MKRLNSWLLVFALSVAPLPALPAEDIPGKIIFSVEQVTFETMRSDRPWGRTGIFYYFREAGSSEYDRASLIGYRFLDGKITDSSSLDEEQIKKLQSLPVSTFDVAGELDAARQKMRTQTRRIFSVSDGAEYRIRYNFNGVSIDYKGQTPGAYIDVLAPFSENLTHLKELLDFLALIYGRKAFSQ